MTERTLGFRSDVYKRQVFGYITGMLTRSMMDSIIEQTMSGERTPVQE